MSINIKKILSTCIKKKDIIYKDMLLLFSDILNKKISPIMITAIIIALRSKGESIDEIIASAKIAHKFATKIPMYGITNILDIVGTGGDMSNTFNISTASMFVVAAAGVNVAKHGGRCMSSSSGSADVLEKLGVNIHLNPKNIYESILKTKIGFISSFDYHISMRHIFALRKEIGIKTIFNIIAPLINPVCTSNILMGVFSKKLVKIQINVLKKMGIKRAIVVCGQDNLDEITLDGYTKIGELINYKINEYIIHPNDFGIKTFPSKNLCILNADESKKKIIDIFKGIKSPFSDIVIFNSGVALYISGNVTSILEGINKAKNIINSGLAMNKMKQFIKITNTFNK